MFNGLGGETAVQASCESVNSRWLKKMGGSVSGTFHDLDMNTGRSQQCSCEFVLHESRSKRLCVAFLALYKANQCFRATFEKNKFFLYSRHEKGIWTFAKNMNSVHRERGDFGRVTGYILDWSTASYRTQKQIFTAKNNFECSMNPNMNTQTITGI